MGDIIPFISRLVGRLDWSAGEKARLQQLADKLAHEDLDLEVVFGRSDQGEPWCAVTGEDQEVLVHIARIGGRFIVHHLAQDVLETGSTLWAAVERALGEAWGDLPVPRLAEVTPLDAHVRQTHILSALVVAAILIEAETDPLSGTGAEPAISPTVGDETLADAPQVTATDAEGAMPSRAGQDEAARPTSGAKKLAPLAPQEQEETQAPEGAAPAPAPAKAAAIQPEEAPVTVAEPDADAAQSAPPHLVGGEGDDVLTGSDAGDVLLGGAGNDTLRGGGAPEGIWDWLHGGAGDDRLELSEQVVAAGGAGADRFVFSARPGGEADQVMGRVVDFTPSEGDVLASDGRPGVLVTATPEADILGGTPPPAGFGPNAPLPGFRVGVDTTGDGNADGVLLLAGAEVGGFVSANLRGTSVALEPSAAETVTLRPAPDDGAFLL